MLDYKNILTLRYAAGLSGSEIARRLDNASKTGVNDFLRAFELDCFDSKEFIIYYHHRTSKAFYSLF